MIQTHGVADQKNTLEMIKSIPKTMVKYKSTRLLIDHSAISWVSGGILDIYNRPQELREIGVPSSVKIAEVVLPAHKELFAFLETVCRNCGFDFLIFDDRKSAIQWLTK